MNEICCPHCARPITVKYHKGKAGRKAKYDFPWNVGEKTLIPLNQGSHKSVSQAAHQAKTRGESYKCKWMSNGTLVERIQ